jgi:hypothetical protein
LLAATYIAAAAMMELSGATQKSPSRRRQSGNADGDGPGYHRRDAERFRTLACTDDAGTPDEEIRDDDAADGGKRYAEERKPAHEVVVDKIREQRADDTREYGNGFPFPARDVGKAETGRIQRVIVGGPDIQGEQCYAAAEKPWAARTSAVSVTPIVIAPMAPKKKIKLLPKVKPMTVAVTPSFLLSHFGRVKTPAFQAAASAFLFLLWLLLSSVNVRSSRNSSRLRSNHDQ